ncbi:MAG: ureidoglycolate lyase [Acidimicrobiales bacterium]
MAEERAGGSASGNGDGRYVYPEALTRESWGPFGWLPVDDTDPTDGSNRLEFEWGDPHVNVIGHGLSEVPRTQRGLRCEMMYRHDTHTQTIMPINTLAVVAVAPPSLEFSNEGDLNFVKAFLLHPLVAFVLHRGTWHWGPFPVSDPMVRLFNVQGFRYQEDNRRVDLKELGISFEVVLEV